MDNKSINSKNGYITISGNDNNYNQKHTPTLRRPGTLRQSSRKPLRKSRSTRNLLRGIGSNSEREQVLEVNKLLKLQKIRQKHKNFEQEQIIQLQQNEKNLNNEYERLLQELHKAKKETEKQQIQSLINSISRLKPIPRSSRFRTSRTSITSSPKKSPRRSYPFIMPDISRSHPNQPQTNSNKEDVSYYNPDLEARLEMYANKYRNPDILPPSPKSPKTPSPSPKKSLTTNQSPSTKLLNEGSPKIQPGQGSQSIKRSITNLRYNDLETLQEEINDINNDINISKKNIDQSSKNINLKEIELIKIKEKVKLLNIKCNNKFKDLKEQHENAEKVIKELNYNLNDNTKNIKELNKKLINLEIEQERLQKNNEARRKLPVQSLILPINKNNSSTDTNSSSNEENEKPIFFPKANSDTLKELNSIRFASKK